MKTIKGVLPRALACVVIFTVVCGVIYTAAVTAIAQVAFPEKANGSIIEVDGKKYGCELLGQQFSDGLGPHTQNLRQLLLGNLRFDLQHLEYSSLPAVGNAAIS